MLNFADHRNPESLAAKLRNKRFSFFEDLLSSVSRPMNILDVGGTVKFWESLSIAKNHDFDVTIVNVMEQTSAIDNIRVTVGDARKLNFDVNQFDVVYSNSVIEHVGSYADQRMMANEVQRVGKRFIVQTPSYFFPIEPHFLFPGFQYLPIDVRAWLLTKRSLGWVERVPEFEQARSEVASVRLLGKRDFAALFPDATIYEEKIVGVVKSFVAYGGWDALR